MFRTLSRLFAVAVLLTSGAHALEPGDRVKNFTLKDMEGKSRELYKLADKKAIVVMIQGNGCPIVRLAMPDFRAVRDRFAGDNVEFLLMNSNLQDTAQAVKDEATEFQYGLPIWLDSEQKVGEAWQVVRTGEIFVIDPKTWTLKYHGPVDDRHSYEKQKPPKHHYLADALAAVIAGKPVTVPRADSPGCLINFPNRDSIR